MEDVTTFIQKTPECKLSYLADIGRRDYMEDRMDLRMHNGGLLITICDGHGGSACAEFVIQEYPKQVVKLMTGKTRPSTALKEALKIVNKDWDVRSLGTKRYPNNLEQRTRLFSSIDKKTFESEGLASGTTLLVCYLDPVARKGYVLNLGDSRAQWQIGHLVCATKDHKPNFLDAEQLSSFPVWIQDDEGTLRVNGDLAVGRTIGDNTEILTGCLMRDPFIYTFAYPKDTLKLIMASDGLWDEKQAQDLFHNKHSCYDFIGGQSSTDDNISIVYLVHECAPKT